VLNLNTKLKKFEEIKAIYAGCVNSRNTCESIELLIETESENIPDYDRKQLWAAFSDGDGPYFILNRFRSAEEAEKEALRTRTLKEIDFGNMPEHYADILADLETNPGYVISILKKLKKSKIIQYVQRLYNKKPEFEEFFEQYALSGPVRDDDINALRVFTGVAYVILYIKAAVSKSSGTDFEEQYYTIFKRYIEKGHCYIKSLYNPERLRLYYRTLEDQEDVFFIALNYAREALERGNTRAAINYFREAARANVYMVGYMKKYKDELFGDAAEFGDDLDINGREE